MLRHVVCYKLTDVSEMSTASIIIIIIIALITEEGSISETSENRTKRCNIPDDSHLYNRRVRTRNLN